MSVIDITPLIRAKQQSQCEHPQVEVSLTEAELTCSSCKAPIDPWWYIRRQATAADSRRAVYEQKYAEIEADIARTLETLQSLKDEIGVLNATRSRLWNERVGGRALGAQVRRPRARARRT